MKKVLLLLILLAPAPLYSLTLDLHLGIPFSYKFDQATDGYRLHSRHQPNGLLLGLGLQNNLVAFIEDYQVPISESGGMNVRHQLVDLAYKESFSFLIFKAGVGIGRSSMIGPSKDLYRSEWISQMFVHLGLPFSEIFSVSGGYHKVNSKVGFKDYDLKIQTGGTMTSVQCRYLF